MIKVLEQPIGNNIITLSDLNNGDVFMMINTSNNEINRSLLLMRIKQEENCSYICWNFSGNYYENVSPYCPVHKCATVTLRYTL